MNNDSHQDPTSSEKRKAMSFDSIYYDSSSYDNATAIPNNSEYLIHYTLYEIVPVKIQIKRLISDECAGANNESTLIETPTNLIGT